jgi:Tfp pilus assembly protein PilN
VIENLNLASQPFRNRTLPWTVAVVVALVSIAALAFTLSQWRETRARAAAVERDVQGLHAESNQLRRQAGEINGQFTDEQRRTLDAAHLIVDRRNFSWSRLLADLETTLPQGVRVSRITVRDINGSGGRARAELELAVLARNAADVTNMIGEMSGSGIFSADLLTQNQAPKGEAGIEATMRVRYTPPAGRSVSPNDNAAQRREAQPATRTDATRATAHAEATR